MESLEDEEVVQYVDGIDEQIMFVIYRL